MTDIKGAKASRLKDQYSNNLVHVDSTALTTGTLLVDFDSDFLFLQLK